MLSGADHADESGGSSKHRIPQKKKRTKSGPGNWCFAEEHNPLCTIQLARHLLAHSSNRWIVLATLLNAFASQTAIHTIDGKS